jgi:hypothetical protein
MREDHMPVGKLHLEHGTGEHSDDPALDFDRVVVRSHG